MKKLAKLFLLVFVFALMASVLVACGEEKSGEEKNGEQSEQPSTPVVTPEPPTEEEVSDLVYRSVIDYMGNENVAINAQDKSLHINVSSDTTSFNLNSLSLPEGMTVKVFEDGTFSKEISGTVELQDGENIFFVSVEQETTFVFYRFFITKEAEHVHSFNSGWTQVVDPTCTEKGLRKCYCECGEEKTEEIEALGHDIIQHEGKEPTCTEIGWEAYDTCSRCDYTTYEEIEAKGHTEVIDEAVAPTCTETGLTEGKHCSVCKEILVAQEVALALGHDYKPVVIEATETEEGYTTYTCSRCGDSYIVYDVPEKAVGLEYSLLPDETYSVTGYTGSYAEVVVPSKHNGVAVTSIGDSAFYNCSNLTSVTIGNGVTSIGYDAFSGCNGLTSITLGNSVTNIGDNAFYECSSLTSVTIPDSVTSIGNYAFENCSSLTSVYYTGDIASWCGITFGDYGYSNPLYYAHNFYIDNELVKDIVIPDTVTEIKGYAFQGWNGTSITIPDSVTSIGYSAFLNCPIETATIPAIAYVNNSNLKTVVITSGESIGNYAFEYCGSLTSITIPNSVTSIGKEAFYYCSSLTSITIPDSVTSIGDNAFSNCSSLTSITIPDSVTSIGEYAFSWCSSLTSINIPDGVTSIEIGAFSGCSSLTSINIPDRVTSIRDNAFSNCSGLTSVTIGNSVTSIGSSAFSNCSNLTSITLGNSVTSIEYEAFSYCSGLTSITIPDSATSIGYSAFYNCPIETATIPTLAISYIPKSNLKTVVITSGESIESNAFSSCRSLTSVTIGNGVTSIGDGAFANCSSLTSVYYTGDIASWCGITFSGYYSNPLSYVHNLYINNEIISGEVVLPNTVTKIPGYTFRNSNITSITIPDSVTNIGDQAFSGCPIETATIPAIACSYVNNSNLKTVVITSGESIGGYAFRDCISLTSITIGNSVTSIGYGAFSGCSSLTSVYYTGDIASWCGITFNDNYYSNPLMYAHNLYINNELIKEIGIPDTVTVIKAYAFYGWNGTSITIPDSVTSIGSSAFNNCPIETATIPTLAISYIPKSNLKTVVITSGESIGDKAFYNCHSLTSITIPDSVTSIEEYAFCDCSSLTSVYYTGDIASWCGITFSNYDSNPLRYAHNLYIDNELIKDIVIPDTVTEIKGLAFWGWNGTSITIPDSVTSIGSSAFNSCSSLTSVTIGDSVTIIEWYAFEDCSSLTSVTIGDSVTSIGNYAFKNCSSLTSVYYTGDIASWCGITFDYYSNPLSYAHNLYIDNELVKDIVIPDTVTEIKGYAFQGWNGTSITILDSVTSIGYRAFDNCSNLTSITVGNGVTRIGNSAFYNCSCLTSVAIGDGLTSIGSDAFYNCPIETATIPTFAISYIPKSNLKTVVITSGERIGEEAFRNCRSLTSITIGNSVTSIGGGALYDCSNLTSITIPASVTSIGSGAFSGCSSLESITIPFVGNRAGVTSSDTYQYPFGYIFGTRSYTGGTATRQYYYGSSISTTPFNDYHIPSTLKIVTVTGGYIPYGAFYNCSSLTNITLDNGVTSIGERAFRYCSSLTSVSIGNGITSIGRDTFENCYHLVEVYNKSSLNIEKGSQENGYVGYYAKAIYTEEYTSKLSTDSNGYVIYTDGEEKSLIMYAGEETELTLPEGITEINQGAFYNNKITSITIPDSVTSIGYNAFYNCPIETATIPTLAISYIPKSNLKTVVIISGESIGDKAFSYCRSLTSITIPDSVTSIGGSAFSYCRSLTSITIPDSVTSIGSNAFYGCYRLVEVYNKSSLNIEKGSTVNGYVGYYAKAIYTEEYTSKLSTDSNGYIIYTDGEEKSLIMYTGEETELTLPEGITEINQRVFYENNKITSITIPDSVTSIGEDAFSSCGGLTSITIPNSVTSIGNRAFFGCSSLQYNEYDNGYYLGNDNNPYIILVKAKNRSITSCTIYKDTKFIHSSAFDGCSSLTSITIPDSVTSIGRYAFDGCSSLTSITIPDSVTIIGDEAFSYCRSLTNITLGNSVTSIGYRAFEDCYHLVEVYNKSSLYIQKGGSYGDVGYYAKAVYTEEYTSKLSTDSNGYIIYTDGEEKILIGYTGEETELTLPEGITEINQYAFYGNNKITSITIPDSVTSIGYRAFYNCSSLTSITFQGTKEEWNAISKGSDWNYDTEDYTVHCTDGDITK